MTSRKAAGLLFGLPLVALPLDSAPRSPKTARTTVSQELGRLGHAGSHSRRSPQGSDRAARPASGRQLGDRRRDEEPTERCSRPTRSRRPPSTKARAGRPPSRPRQDATPLIGEAADQGRPAHQRLFQQHHQSARQLRAGRFHQQAHHRPLLRAAAGQDQVRLRAAERAPHRRRRRLPRHRGFRPQDGREISHQVDAVPPATRRRGRSRPRCPHRRGRKPGGDARHLARGQRRAMPPAASSSCSTTGPSSS